MPLRHRNVLPFAAVLLALAVAPALAAKDAPNLNPFPAAPVPDASITAAPCILGQNEAGVGAAAFILPPNDAYQTLIDLQSAACACGSSAFSSVAQMTLNWPTNCSVQVSVSILGALGTAACYTPDLTNVLCPATIYTIDGTGGPLKVHDFPQPAGCCITGPAFL